MYEAINSAVIGGSWKQKSAGASVWTRRMHPRWVSSGPWRWCGGLPT